VSAGHFEALIGLAALSVIGGAIGGLASCYLRRTSPKQGHSPNKSNVFSHICLGIAAAFTVPLFLTLVQSKLAEELFDLEVAKARNNLRVYDDWFVYIGICIIAAMSARAFIAALSGEVLATLEHHSRLIEENREHIQANAKIIEHHANKIEHHDELLTSGEKKTTGWSCV